MSDLATFLFARPTTSEGAARILDFGNTLSEYNRRPTGEQSDWAALSADWALIGGDLRAAYNGFLRDQARVEEIAAG